VDDEVDVVERAAFERTAAVARRASSPWSRAVNNSR